MWVGVASAKHMLKREYDNHSNTIVNVKRGEAGGGGGGLYDHLMNTLIFSLTMNKIFIRALEIKRKVATASIWTWYPSLVQIACFVSHEKVASWDKATYSRPIYLICIEACKEFRVPHFKSVN